MLRAEKAALAALVLLCCGCSSGEPAAPPSNGGGWTAAGSLTTGRERHTAVVLGSRVLFVGGVDGADEPISSVEIFDLSALSVLPGPALTTARWGHSLTALPGGRLLAAGGFGPDGPLSSVEILDPAGTTWTPGPAMAATRYQHTAVLQPEAKQVLVCGGYSSDAGVLHATCEAYGIGKQLWTPVAALEGGRAGHSATALPDGRVLVAGGTTGTGPTASTEIFSPALGRWIDGPDLCSPRQHHVAVGLALPPGVLVIGGESAAVDLFDAATGLVTPLPGLPAPLSGHTAALLPDGRVLVVGGEGEGPAAKRLDAVRAFDPVLRRWAEDSRIARARSYHQATLLPSARVLVSGGRGAQGSLEISLPYAPGPDGAVADLGDGGPGEGQVGEGGPGEGGPADSGPEDTLTQQ
jgi:hypothetical protein